MNDQTRFDVDGANHEQLMTFARNELGLGFPPNLSVDKLRERVRDKLLELEGVPAAPPRRVTVVQDVIPLKDLPRDQTAVITIAEGDERAVNPVPVIVNGRRFDIRRGHCLRVPGYVETALHNAVETRYFRVNPDDLESPLLPRNVPSYPYQLHPVDTVAENDPPAAGRAERAA